MLSGQTVVITGGSGLLGRQFCAAIVAANGIAIIASRNTDEAAQVAKELNPVDSPQQIFVQELDMTNSKSVRELFEAVPRAFGSIDAVVNNALPNSPNYGRVFEKVELEDLTDHLGAHVGGYFLMCREAIKYFKTLGGGNIVNIGSVYGMVAPRFELYAGTKMTKELEYVLAKAAIHQLTIYLASYCRGRKIRVNGLIPGGIFDDQHSDFIDRYNDKCLNKGMLNPNDISGALVFLLSNKSQYINGQNIVVDDGFVLGL